jgi:hypothetical protein
MIMILALSTLLCDLTFAVLTLLDRPKKKEK